MNSIELAQVAFLILLVVAAPGCIAWSIYKLNQESQRYNDEWNRRSHTLRCPHCKSLSEGWSGESWGVDSEPPGYDGGGIILVCPRCNDRGYVREDDGEFTVFSSIASAADIKSSHTSIEH